MHARSSDARHHPPFTPFGAFWRQPISRIRSRGKSIRRTCSPTPRRRRHDRTAGIPSRSFFHAEQSYHVDSGIKQPGDLIGKRIGVGEYQQTAALWARGVLEHDFGVSQYKVDWYMERTDELSHGGATGFAPPQGISLYRIPPDKSMASMLVNHEIDVAPGRAPVASRQLIDRSTQSRAAPATGQVNLCFPTRSPKPDASGQVRLRQSISPTLFSGESTASRIGHKLYDR